MRDILLFDIMQFLYDVCVFIYIYSTLEDKIVGALGFFYVIFFFLFGMLLVKGCMFIPNSKLQTEFPSSFFNLNGLIFPSGFHVLQYIGNDCDGSQRKKKKVNFFFLKSIFFSVYIHWG